MCKVFFTSIFTTVFFKEMFVPVKINKMRPLTCLAAEI